MARIRSIKPEFFVDEDLQDLELEHPGSYCMMVFAGLWGHCSKDGVFEYRPRILKLSVLPFLPFDMADTLGLLEGAGFIRRFYVEGKEYGYIPTFTDHQRISGKEAQYSPKLPQYIQDNTQGSTGEAPGKNQGSDREAQEKEKEKEKEKESTAAASSQASTTPAPSAAVEQQQQQPGDVVTVFGDSAQRIRSAFKERQGFLQEQFSHLNLAVEEEQCVAKYRGKPIGGDAAVLVLEWCKRVSVGKPDARSRDRPAKSKAQEREDATIEAGREALRLMRAAREANDDQGRSGDAGDYPAGGGAGFPAYPAADCGVLRGVG